MEGVPAAHAMLLIALNRFIRIGLFSPTKTAVVKCIALAGVAATETSQRLSAQPSRRWPDGLSGYDDDGDLVRRVRTVGPWCSRVQVDRLRANSDSCLHYILADGHEHRPLPGEQLVYLFISDWIGSVTYLLVSIVGVISRRNGSDSGSTFCTSFAARGHLSRTGKTDTRYIRSNCTISKDVMSKMLAVFAFKREITSLA